MGGVDDALDMQCDLYARLGSEFFTAIVRETLRPHWARFMEESSLPVLVEWMRAHVLNGATYHIDENMTPVIVAAANGLRDIDRFELEQLPAESGFAYLPRPIEMVDVRGNTMLIHMITWGPIKVGRREGPPEFEGDVPNEYLVDGVLFSMWNDTLIQPDHYGKILLRDPKIAALRRHAGRWSLIGAEILYDGIRVGSREAAVVLDGENDYRVFTNVIRHIVAMFLLLDQTIVETRTRRANVHTRRRVKERRMRQRDVNIVTLRRRVVLTEGEGDARGERRDVEWSCRWVVGLAEGGHWHRYRVGKGRGEVRRRWVLPYVKGPQDKPLVVREKVYRLSR